MKRANQPTTTVCRIVGTHHPAGVSEKTNKKYDAFVSFKIHDGKSITDFRFMKDDPAKDTIINAVINGATTFDIPCDKLYRFEKDDTHRFPVVIGRISNIDDVIVYDAPDDLPF